MYWSKQTLTCNGGRLVEARVERPGVGRPVGVTQPALEGKQSRQHLTELTLPQTNESPYIHVYMFQYRYMYRNIYVLESAPDGGDIILLSDELIFELTYCCCCYINLHVGDHRQHL